MEEEINTIPPEMTQRVMENIWERLHQCIAKERSYLSTILLSVIFFYKILHVLTLTDIFILLKVFH